MDATKQTRDRLTHPDQLDSGVEAAMRAEKLEPFDSLGQLRRNLVVRGLSAEALNEMVGHEMQVGDVRLFVHRR